MTLNIPGTPVYEVRTTDTIRLRSSAGILPNNTIEPLAVGVLLGVISQETTIANNLNWLHVQAPDGKIGYVAAKYTVKVDPVAVGDRLLLGWNHIEGNGITRDDLMNKYIKPMYNSGHPMPLLVVISSTFDLANEALPYVGQVILRYGESGLKNPDASKLTSSKVAIKAGRDWVTQYKYVFDGAKPGIAVQLTNEWDGFKYTQYESDFWLGAFMQANDIGRASDFIAFSDSTGNPTIEVWKAREDVLRALMKYGGKVGIHEYGVPPDKAVSDLNNQQDYGMRHPVLIESVPEDCRPVLFVTETGRDNGNFPGAEPAKADLSLYNHQNQSSGAKALAGYLVGSTDQWARSCHDEILPWYLTYGEGLLPYNSIVIIPPPPVVVTSTKGVDLSRYQATVDLVKAKADGISFVLNKALQSTNEPDPLYFDHKQKALAAGLLFGAYHFINGNADPVEEANDFLKIVGDDVKVLALDWEYDPTTGEKTATAAQAEAFVQRIHAVRGRWPLLYLNLSTANSIGDNHYPGLTEGCPLWLAEWTNGNPTLPKWWTHYTIWQYGSTTVNGIGSGIDGNLFNGTVDQLQAFWNI